MSGQFPLALCTLSFLIIAGNAAPQSCSTLCSNADVYYRYRYVDNSARRQEPLTMNSLEDDINDECVQERGWQCCSCSCSTHSGSGELNSLADDSATVLACSGLSDALADLFNRSQMIPDSKVLQFSVLLRGAGKQLVVDLKQPYTFKKVDSAAIQGTGDVTVNCSNGAGIVFETSKQIAIAGMKWVGCGRIEDNSSAKDYGGGILFITCNNVTLTNVTFERSNGSAVLFAVSNSVLDETFSYKISSCHFNHNTMSTFGGGVVVHVDLIRFRPKLIFEGSTFTDNSVKHGGGVYLLGPSRSIFGSCSEPSALFSGCIFQQNNADGSGGAVYVRNFITKFDECKFQNNTGHSAAVRIHVEVPMCLMNLTEMNFCQFEGNSAQKHAAVDATDGSNNAGDYSIVFRNSWFQSNNIGSTNRYMSGSEGSSCIFGIERLQVYLIDTNITCNAGTGVCMNDANAIIGGAVFLVHNHGYLNGGGMYLTGISEICIGFGSNLYFLNNKAVFGGGISAWTPDTSETCIFSFPKSTTAASPLVLFENNIAFVEGDSIYIHTPSQSCKNLNSTNQKFSFKPNNSRLIASGVDIVHILQNEQNVIPGQSIPVEAEVFDFYQHPTSAQVSAFFLEPGEYSLEGKHDFTLQNGTTLPSLRVTGPNKPSNLTLNFVASPSTPHQINNSKIVLNIRQCTVGFVYNSSTEKCQCANNIQSYIACEIATGKACIRMGYWIGTVNTTNDSITVVAPCSSPSCENVNDNCNANGCQVFNHGNNFCGLPNNSRLECLGNRDGILCASCSAAYSFTFRAVECVPTTNCEGVKLILLFILILFYLVIIVFLLILFLKLDYKISSGYVFSFIYYFSIVDYLLPTNKVGKPLLVIVSVFESITQLNPQFLSYTPLCVPHLSAMLHQVFLYVNPLIISVLVISFIFISKCCQSYLRFSDNTPVRAVCLLILLSFTTLNETSLSLLGYIDLIGDGKNSIYVLIQPTVQYLHGIHILFFIIAVSVEILLITPFTLFLFLSPFLVRIVNLTKVKPFLDEFQGCYKDNFRWMAAFYFFCRQIYLLLVLLLQVNQINTTYALQLLSLAILIVHMLFQPYRSQWLNLVDTVFLADILIITLLYGQTANVVFGPMNSPGFTTRMVITYALVCIPIIYFIAIIVVAVFHRFPNTSEKLVNVICCKKCKEKTLDIEEVSSYTHVRSPSQDSVSNFREPLISDEDEQRVERNTGRRSRTTRNWRFPAFSYQSRHRTSYSVVGDPRELEKEAIAYTSIVESSRHSGSQTWQEGNTDTHQSNLGNDDL